MKNFIYILFSILGLSMMFSCDDELKTMVPLNADEPTITSSNDGTYILERINKEKDFQTIEWTDADFKINVAEEYSLQIDVVGGSFDSKKTIAEGITSPYTISIGAFNKALLNAGFADGQEHEIDLRIISNNFLTSERIKMKVTTYFDSEPYSIIGSAVGGWDPANDKYMTYNQENEEYHITLDMKPGEFKFRAPVKDPKDAWAFNYGLDGDGVTYDNAKDITLKDNGANIKVSGGNYTVTFSVKNSLFSIVQNSATEFTDWADTKLDAVGEGITLENANAKVDESTWKWGNALIADNEGVSTKDGLIFTWTWKNVLLDANKGFKIRNLNAELSSNGIEVNAGFEALDADNSSAKAAAAGDNLSVTEAGAYDITVTIDAGSGNATKIIIAEPAPLYPANIYMVGDAINGWVWDDTTPEMVAVNGQPNLFWKIVWLKAGGSFKLSPKKAWGEDFGGSDEKTVKEEYAKGGKNIPARAESGYYMIVLDLDANKIAVSVPTVYLMGDAVGAWDTANADALFTVDNANKKLSISKTLAATDGLRMYAWHSYFSDWWRSEFNIFSDKIEFRGNNGDQEKVGVAALPTVIELNFMDNTGTIAQ